MMQPGSNSASNTPYTILRIKRKRNEEPLDALVVESRVRKKKTRGGLEVFQFAQTVEDEAWKDESQKRVIQDEVSRLAREASDRKESKQTKDEIPDKLKLHGARQKREGRKRCYTVLQHGTSNEDVGRRTYPKKPPTVVSAKEAAQPIFKMYDAIPSPEKTRPSVDSDIEKFLPLLNDYLTLNEISLSAPDQQKKEQDTVIPLVDASKIPKTTRDDYVWDIFYRRPAKADEWVGRDNIATLMGLPPSYGDELYDSASDSELEDEEDEDSNAEEYYKNDYPDEEDLSDEFHEYSSYEDLLMRDEDDHEEEDIF
ncbi:hypothetical protein AX15_000164 [Amanita polypyramis BW_CC]|nr:hypothetical protein AX15_000164 [Amanita polypyramis BW_CC]